MRIFMTAAFVSAATFAAPAFAWNETQPASNGMAVWAYPTEHNYCPAGLQPVMIGGVVCCGTPTHHGNPYAHPVSKPRKVHKHVVQHSKAPTEVIVYEKGQ